MAKISKELVSLVIAHSVLIYGVWFHHWGPADLIWMMWLELGLAAMLESVLLVKRLGSNRVLGIYYIAIFIFMFYQLGNQMYFYLVPLGSDGNFLSDMLLNLVQNWWSVIIVIIHRAIRFVDQWKTAQPYNGKNAQTYAQNMTRSSWGIIKSILPMSLSSIVLISAMQYNLDLTLPMLLSLPILVKFIIECWFIIKMYRQET